MVAPPSWPPTRPSLMLQLQDSDDHAAWSSFVTIYAPLIHRYCRWKGLQDADSADVTQDVLVKVRKFRYHGERGRFRGWLATVARREVAHTLRARMRAPAAWGAEVGGVEPESGGIDLDWDRICRARLLESALERIRPEFSARSWSVFERVVLRTIQGAAGRELRWVDDPDYKRAALDLGCPVGWVYKVKCLMLGRLRAEVLFLADDLSLLA